MTCDICGKVDGDIELTCPNTRFRKIRKVCWSHYCTIEEIRMRHANDAYKYGKSDWYERLCRNVKKDIKKLYRKYGK